jgi:hypothetical protein
MVFKKKMLQIQTRHHHHHHLHLISDDNNENAQLQENIETNNTDIDQQDETTELQGNDNNTIFG